MSPAIFPITYFPPVTWFSAAIRQEELWIEIYQHFRKQQYTSRMRIKTANRILPLSIPVERRGLKMPIKDKKISYAENWQKQHWGSIIAVFRNSPYFEYYEEELEAFFRKKYTFLIDLNLDALELLWKWMKISIPIHTTEEYFPKDHYSTDFRNDFDPSGQSLPDWFRVKEYPQVFEGFTPGLSVLDLFFNMGPESRQIMGSSVSETYL